MVASQSEQAKGSAGDVAAGMMAVLEMETGVEAGWLASCCAVKASRELEQSSLAACCANNPDLFRFVRRQGITICKARLQRRAQFACAEEKDGRK
jgi:hypothetical protein